MAKVRWLLIFAFLPFFKLNRYCKLTFISNPIKSANGGLEPPIQLICQLSFFAQPAQGTIWAMKRKISLNELTVRRIDIECTVKRPGRHADYWERLRLNGYGFDYKRHYYSVEVRDEEYSVKMDTKDWIKTFHAIAAEAQVIQFQESDSPLGPIHYDVSVFSFKTMEEKEVHLNDHPRISANKKLLDLLKRIAAAIPDGWLRPYCLDHLD